MENKNLYIHFFAILLNIFLWTGFWFSEITQKPLPAWQITGIIVMAVLTWFHFQLKDRRNFITALLFLCLWIVLYLENDAVFLLAPLIFNLLIMRDGYWKYNRTKGLPKFFLSFFGVALILFTIFGLAFQIVAIKHPFDALLLFLPQSISCLFLELAFAKIEFKEKATENSSSV